MTPEDREQIRQIFREELRAVFAEERPAVRTVSPEEAWKAADGGDFSLLAELYEKNPGAISQEIGIPV